MAKLPRLRNIRPIPHFRLRTFLLVILMTGICSGVFGSRILYITHVIGTIPEIERLGGQVYSDFFKRYGLYPPTRTAKNRGVLEWVLSDPMEVSLFAHKPKDSEDLMRMVGTMTSIRSLRLVHVRDQDLSQITRLRNLETLHLEDSTVNDHSLATLCRMPNLREINLANVRIVDTGLWHSARLTVLGKIQIRRSVIASRARRMSAHAGSRYPTNRIQEREAPEGKDLADTLRVPTRWKSLNETRDASREA